MLIITRNTYPEDGIGKYKVGTLCDWRVVRGHLLLSLCNKDGKFVREYGNYGNYTDIMSKGQIYNLNGNLMSKKTEPAKVGIVAKYVKMGYYLELAKV